MVAENEFKLALGILEDANKVIAAGKAQRWEVLKWAVALNLALPAAMIAVKANQPQRGLYAIIATAIAIVGVVLILHYTWRMTGARNEAAKAYRFLSDGGLRIASMTASPKAYTDRVPFTHDAQELIVFPFVLAVSCLPAWMVACSAA